MQEYRLIEKALQKAIYNKFGIFDEDPEELHIADAAALGQEALLFMSPLTHPQNWDWAVSKASTKRSLSWLPPERAKELFLKRFTELF